MGRESQRGDNQSSKLAPGHEWGAGHLLYTLKLIFSELFSRPGWEGPSCARLPVRRLAWAPLHSRAGPHSHRSQACIDLAR